MKYDGLVMKCILDIKFAFSYEIIDKFCMVKDGEISTILPVIVFKGVVAVGTDSNDLFYPKLLFAIRSKTYSLPSLLMASPQQISSAPRIPKETDALRRMSTMEVLT
jgi:hypothetical protein